MFKHGYTLCGNFQYNSILFIENLNIHIYTFLILFIRETENLSFFHFQFSLHILQYSAL